MELYTSNNTQYNHVTEVVYEPETTTGSTSLGGFNKKIYVHSYSGTVIIGWVRKIYYSTCSGKIQPFEDDNWRKYETDLVNGQAYDIQLISGELLFDSTYDKNAFTVKVDFLQRVIHDTDVKWVRESK